MCDEHPKFLDDAYLDVNDFEVTDESLGEGNQGRVFKCYRKSDRKLFVIKLIKSAFNDARATKLFLREVEVQVRLSHKYFSIFRGFTIPGDSPAAIILDYMPNGNLHAFLNSESVKLTDVACIMYGLAVEIEYMHSHKCMHRDLKPQNIMLDWDMRPRLTDFGLARDMEDITSPTTEVGNTMFNAPELASYEGDGKYNFPADVFALGLVLWELATGKYAYDDAEPSMVKEAERSIQEVKRKFYGPWRIYKASINECIQWMKENDCISKIQPTNGGRMMSGELREVLLQCVCSEPSKRLTAKQLVEKLRHIDVGNMLSSSNGDQVDVEVYNGYVQMLDELFYT